MSTEQTIKDQIAANPILLYMKGNPEAPQCGFSSQATQLLMACGKKVRLR
jgi:monothiol glutaredoxin